ncbi:MAG: 50S ribosomal protein L20 [Elusimicrobia bacterium RIFCSPLOWO2_01_FULL_64_13]|nr:MAG: 50S ribosomal protein L20 [Elusimicrobia bacterium RIFCSPHIGHO2_01_FULL_64_10]OGR95828.1 MAG: 50S ribosomal protein L20 [Elusimicrobia bacterium RIFCSPLOWO2_01_FULL_64_13]
MRVKSGVTSRHRKKKTFRLTKGYYSNRGNRWRQASQQADRSLRYSTVARKDRKGDFRKLWITRINAAVRSAGLSYSRFIFGLKKSNIQLNRKMLAELAVNDAPMFNEIIQQSRAAQ